MHETNETWLGQAPCNLIWKFNFCLYNNSATTNHFQLTPIPMEIATTGNSYSSKTAFKYYCRMEFLMTEEPFINQKLCHPGFNGEWAV
eukprot:4698393-Amphidinium_carterae.1